MSCHWHIYCKTCDSKHEFAGGNHQTEFMKVLITHASVIGTLKPLIDDRRTWVDITLHTTEGSIDVDWFAEHHTHVLVPRNEYGEEYCEPPDPVT